MPYERDIQNFETLRAFVPWFREAKAYIRITEPVAAGIKNELPLMTGIPASNRDRAVCALANKATNTHAAVKVLADAGHGDDAMALTRVLLENVAVLKWLLLDKVYRLDLFCISDALFRRRWLRLVEQHYQEKPEFVQQVRKMVDSDTLKVAELFGNTHHRWARVLDPEGKAEHVSIEGMFEEITHGTRSAHDPTFVYDVVYFLHSAFVHSSASAMRSFPALRQKRFFTLSHGPISRGCDQALGGANIMFWQGLDAVPRLGEHSRGFGGSVRGVEGVR